SAAVAMILSRTLSGLSQFVGVFSLLPCWKPAETRPRRRFQNQELWRITKQILRRQCFPHSLSGRSKALFQALLISQDSEPNKKRSVVAHRKLWKVIRRIERDEDARFAHARQTIG